MTSRRILLITGGSGYLGRHLTRKAAEDFNVYATYNANPAPIKAGQAVSLNLANRARVLNFVTELKPQIIIHTAAVNPGDQDQNMMPVNAGGSRYVAEAAVAVGARLIHLSSDLVHDGKNSPYDDEASPTPLNLYGRSKAAGEAAVAEVDPQAVMVRTSLIYGLQLLDRGTAGFVERLNTGQPLILFNDVVRQPIWIESLVAALLKLADIDFGGRLNVTGGQPISREEFGRRMLAWWQVDPRGLLRSGRAADISDTIPLDLRLSTAKAEQLLKMTFPGVAEVLARASSGTS